MGIGIGAEYPLSAVITSEWSSTQSRATMLSSVFLMQPVGQALAQLVGVWVVLGRNTQYNLQALQCGINTLHEDDCKRIIDGIWRIVIGSGCVPAVLAIIFRFFLYDCGLYTLEVKAKPGTAFRDTQRVYGPPPAGLSESPYSPSLNRESFQFMPVQYSKENLHDYFIKDQNWHYLLGKLPFAQIGWLPTLTPSRHSSEFHHQQENRASSLFLTTTQPHHRQLGSS